MDFNVNYNKTELRRVTTSFSLNELNDAVKAGHIVLFENIKLNKKLYSRGFLFRDKSTGQVVRAPSRRFPVQYSGWKELPEDQWEDVLKIKGYSRERSLEHDWAAYILPLDPVIGEELYIEDLIEDVFVMDFWGSKIYAVDGIAVWNGKELEFKRELFDSRECMIVG